MIEMEEISLQIIITAVLFIVALLFSLLLINQHKKRKFKNKISQLDYEKNLIEGRPISSELNKIEKFLQNEKLGVMYKDWCTRLEKLKKEEIPQLTDLILETEYSLAKLDYKSAVHKLAQLELEVYRTKTYAETLLGEIMEITTSEEKNRDIIIKLKERYRELYRKFDQEKSEYKGVAVYVKMQFENITARFEKFEELMEKNEYTEVTQVIKSIDEMLKHMEVVVEEVPLIVMTATNVLEKKIVDVQKVYDDMIAQGYPLDYLNVEYNISEAKKKIDDIMDRLKVLNLEDSLFELNALMEYFDSLFTDFEKEKHNRQTYEEAKKQFEAKLSSVNNLVSEIFDQINELKKVYKLSEADIKVLQEKKQDLDQVNDDYKVLLDHTKNNTFAYSKLINEIKGLTERIKKIESEISATIKAIGNMKEDEARARQQLDEIKHILKEGKGKIREYSLPVIPKTYHIELSEASAAVKEVMKELNKMPITISILNTRVDTARDLALKFFATNKETIKVAMFAEMAIVYSNRYRGVDNDLEKNIAYAEVLFFRGEYQKSLDLTINALNRFHPKIYEKLLALHEKEIKQT